VIGLVRRCLALIAALLVGGGVQAQIFTYVGYGSNPTAYGVVVAATAGETVFSQVNSTLTVISGSGVKISGTTRRVTITIRCNTDGADTCTNTKLARVRIGNFSTMGRAKEYTEFTAAAGSGVTLNGVTTGAALDFTMRGWTSNGNTRTFTLDTKMAVYGDDVGGDTGALTNTYYVYVAKDPTLPTTGGTVPGTITVRRSLTIDANPTHLRFGSLVKRAASGSGNVEIAQNSDVRVPGGTSPPYLVGSGAEAGRARFRIRGEPNTTFSISYSPTGNVVMNNETMSGTLSITMNKPSSPFTLDATGLYDLYIGGRITINNSSTNRGQYSGTLTVTVTYN
jgi:environmental stress-induced protein Ves